MQHVINRQVIELSIAKGIDAFQVQQAVSNHYRQQLMPLLEKEFDSIAGPDEVVIVDRMEIDLGEITEAELSDASISEYVSRNIVKQLAEKLKDEHTKNESSPMKKTAALNSGAQWLFYMEKGYLPWSLLQTDNHWYGQVLEALATDYSSIEALRKAIYESGNTLRRIVSQHSETFLVKLTEILTAEKQAALPEAVKELSAVLNVLRAPDKNAQEIAAKHLWQEVLTTAASHTATATGQIAEKLLRKHTSDTSTITSQNIAIAKQQAKLLLPSVLQIEKEMAVSSNNFINKATKKNNLAEGINDMQKKGDFVKEPAQNKTVQAKELSVQQIDERNKEPEIIAIGEAGIFLQNAGMVLIHPFIPMLFNRLGLVSEKKFISIVAKEKALFLLHYIVTGNTVADEHELLMPKVLCGHPLEEPVAKEAALSAEEKEEADGLLNAVIQQWSILKKTSSEGLRETFLKRKGKISVKDGSIFMQVESGPVDMLLDHLPWNLSIIKLPWMKNIIKVEWR